MDTRATMTARQAASHLGIGYTNLLRLAKRKDFPAVWIGRKCIVPREGLQRWVDAQRGGDSFGKK